MSRNDWRHLDFGLWDRRDRREHLAALHGQEIRAELPAPPGRQLAPPGFRLFKKKLPTTGDAAREREREVDGIIEALRGKRRR